MDNTVVSIRVDNKLYEKMRAHEEINWSAVIRKIIAQRIENLDSFDIEKARMGARAMDSLRKSKVFDKGKSSLEILKEWRKKRR